MTIATAKNTAGGTEQEQADQAQRRCRATAGCSSGTAPTRATHRAQTIITTARRAISDRHAISGFQHQHDGDARAEGDRDQRQARAAPVLPRAHQEEEHQTDLRHQQACERRDACRALHPQPDDDQLEGGEADQRRERRPPGLRLPCRAAAGAAPSVIAPATDR